jgi:hypothetical protein
MMQKIVTVQNVEGEGLVALLGKRVFLMCNNYFYTGVLEGVNTNCVLLSEAGIVYETGYPNAPAYKDEQRFPADRKVYVSISFIEAFMEASPGK